MNSKHQKGTSSEFAAAKYLVDQGYYIFLRGSVSSPIDLIGINPDTEEIILIDVKTVSKRHKGKSKGKRINRVLSPEQKKLGVQILYYNQDDNTIRLQNSRKTEAA